MLRKEGVTHLADVRAFPASRRHPHFNKEQLIPALSANGIDYTHFPALGGRRKARSDSRNTEWKNAGFRGYADYMETAEFESGLEMLIATAKNDSTAIMCAEAVPWRCHRTLISDALVARGVEVLHILDGGAKPHTLTSFATVRNGRVSYGRNGEPDLFS